MSFTIKCLNVVRQLVEHSAVVFVSHNVQMVSQFCSDIMLLADGKVQIYTSNVSEGIDAYLSACQQTIELSGTGEATVDDEFLIVGSGLSVSEPRSVMPDDSIGINLSVGVGEIIDKAEVSIVLKDNSGRPVASFATMDSLGARLQLSPGNYHCKFDIGCLGLTPGKYHFVVAVMEQNTQRVCMRKDGVLPFTVSDTGNRGHVWAPLSRAAKAEVITM